MLIRRVKVRLFSKEANPLCDRPLLHKSSAYVDGLILKWISPGRRRGLQGPENESDMRSTHVRSLRRPSPV